ncbi:hypothetical protein [Rheinheimera sp. MMS21-TC3]|uniref:hypothetical protein n=1 Tax=Rheinheimera sp. MMS21-TC3 TaxID=3072790 RepID=UPI0028C43D73|nr:hypothetical protein [Rheinheimera sp. MMS21-TC3]WNO60002.1 hypothetical protein RDV63_03335 [Rheinheimera sp. MMS21-TC3]
MTWNKLIWGILLLISPVFSKAECHFNTEQPLLLQLAVASTAPSATQKFALSYNRLLGEETAQAKVELRDAESAALFSHLSDWANAGVHADLIMAEPAILDQNLDGIADAVYVVDINGRVWFIALSASGFSSPVLIADFSAEGAKFTQPLQLVQAAYNVDYASIGNIQRVKVSLVLIASYADTGDSLILFNHQPEQDWLVTLHDLSDRTELGLDDVDIGLTDSVWRDLQQSPGWFIQLGSSVRSKPQVYAGVVYFVAVSNVSEPSSCEINTSDETKLFAIHLHHAGKVYAKRSWQLTAMGKVTLQLNTTGEQLSLSLVNDTEPSEIISEVLAITEDCFDCTEELTTSSFPRTLRLATYMTEFGAW